MFLLGLHLILFHLHLLLLKLKRIYRTFGKSSFGAVTNIRFGLTNIR